MTSPLISATDLARELESAAPPLVLDASFALGMPDFGWGRYKAGHIPGSIFVDVDQMFSGPVREDRRGGRHPLPDPDRLQQDLRALGLDDDSRVVVYDQGPSMGAARVWWVLRDAGVVEVRVLDGGFARWQAAGLPSTSDTTPEPAAGSFTVRPGRLTVVDARGIPQHLASGHQVIDVRTAERFRGESEPIDPVAGHIPGAVNLPAGELSTTEGFKTPDDLREVFSGVGEEDVFSCGSGITAAHALLAAEHAGITGLGIYPGSWSDWISDPDREVATGA